MVRLGADEVETAFDLIASHPPTVAVLDVNLGSATSFAVAHEPLALDNPFMFATGYGEQAKFPNQHRGRSVLHKPHRAEKSRAPCRRC